MKACVTDKLNGGKLDLEIAPNGPVGLKNKNWHLTLSNRDGSPLVKLAGTPRELIIKFVFAPIAYENPETALAAFIPAEEAKALITALRAVCGLEDEIYGRSLITKTKIPTR